MNNEETKNLGGRPTKLTKEWLDIASEVVNDDINAIILTDEELVMEINDRVDDENLQITPQTLTNWKRKVRESKELDENGKEFFMLIKKALFKQKKHLFHKFREEPNQWQRWAWIIERKFDDWNIKHKTDITTKGKEIPQPILNVSRDNSHNQDKETI